MTVVALPTVRGSARRWIGNAALTLLIAGAVILLSAGVGAALGFRALVVRSGSMAPAIESGDVVVTRLVRPTAAQPGDIVTFQDSSRQGDLVTHRVVEVRRESDRVSFVTRGDANTGEERWSIDSHGTIGATAFRVPAAGHVLAWLRTPTVRMSLLVSAALVLAVLALRRIWSG
ncbi:MAG TPA: signal peptidase I [Actinomycetota bacterium]|nr:signal peptidase I [Actinomycetota bacterium]